MVELRARWHRSMAELPREPWENLVASSGLPFYSWSWLVALESSGSIVAAEGWQPMHLSLWRGETMIGVAPLYLKGHSYGEFVFDQSFAKLAGQLGLHYYPKLLGMSPLSPVQGYRFHTAADEDPAELTQLMFQLIDGLCRDNRILSCNLLSVDPAWRSVAEAAGCASWLNQRSQWQNEGFADFDAYLSSFNANQRRNIKRERRSIAQAGLKVDAVEGEAISEALLLRMHHFYAQHCSRWGAWGSKYLSEAFFRQAFEQLRQHLVLFSAHRGDPADPVAMSMCVFSAEDLWGRYWGSDDPLENLHFEVCYYAPIAWAIERGLLRFDPGAGGSHKRRRGFLAQPQTSLHRWYEPSFDRIIRNWLPDANRAMLEEIEAINAELPFSRSEAPISPLDKIDQCQ